MTSDRMIRRVILKVLFYDGKVWVYGCMRTQIRTYACLRCICVRACWFSMCVCRSLARSLSLPLCYFLPLFSPSLSLLSLLSLSRCRTQLSFLSLPRSRLSLTRSLALSLSLLLSLSPSEDATTGAFYTVVPGYSPDSSPGKWQVLDARVCARTLWHARMRSHTAHTGSQ
jgi:hypothetical protein